MLKWLPHFLALAALLTLPATASAEATAVEARVDLIEQLRRGEVEYYLNPDNEFPDKPAAVWVVEDGLLHITGRAYGYAATKAAYRQYRMIVEYRYGEHTWGKRENRARDNGFFVHAHGEHGALGGSWMASFEVQIIDGGTGDLLVLAPKGATSPHFMSASRLDPNRQLIWDPTASLQLVSRGRVNWLHRDPAWSDTKGFRGRQDLENPSGDWNRLEVIADGDHLRVLVNGTLANEASQVTPAEGRILSTCLGAEVFIRRWELLPLANPAAK